MSKEQKVIYEPHPVSTERKAELRAQGYKIIDAKFDPNPKDDTPKPRRVRKNDEQVAE